MKDETLRDFVLDLSKDERKLLLARTIEEMGEEDVLEVLDTHGYRLRKGMESGRWDIIVNGFGELTDFLCECGYGSKCAMDFCPSCGTKMDNTDIENRIQKAIQDAIF